MSLAKYLSKKDAIDLLEINYKAMLSADQNEFKINVLQLHSLLPIEGAYCAYGNAIEGATKSVDIFNSGSFLGRFLLKKLYQIDPVVLELFKTFDIQYWKDVDGKYPVKDIISLVFEEFGTNNGLTFDVSNFSCSNGAIFSFAGRHIKNDDRTRAIIQNTIPHLSVALMRFVEDEKNEIAFNTKMTIREVEVLKWLKEGKSSFEVSMILNISMRTVNFHCNNIMRKLDAVNRVQAVAIALKKRIIGW